MLMHLSYNRLAAKRERSAFSFITFGSEFELDALFTTFATVAIIIVY
jgi:hypothetical protein